MHLWPAIYGALLGAVLWRTFHADVVLRMAALALATDWSASNLLRWYAPLDYRLVFVSSDFLMAVAFIISWMAWRRAWIMVIGALYAISWVIGAVAYRPDNQYSFDLALNAAFLARLAVLWIASHEPRRYRNAHE